MDIRRLHRPTWHRSSEPVREADGHWSFNGPEEVWLVCYGCDAGPYAEGPPSWPCRTAELAYAPEEIAAREPQVPECPHDHRTVGEGPPVRAQAVFARLADGSLEARRFMCDHVAGVPVTSMDPWE